MRNDTRRGYALVMVLLILAVAAILGGALLSVSVGEHTQAAATETNMKTYYNARSAAEVVAETIISDPGGASVQQIKSGQTVRTQNIQYGDSTVAVTIQPETGNKMRIISFANTGSGFSKQASLILEPFSAINPFKGVHSNQGYPGDVMNFYDSFDVPPPADVILSSNGNVTNEDDANWGSGFNHDIQDTDDPGYVPQFFPEPVFPSGLPTFAGSTNTISQSGYYQNLGNKTITIENASPLKIIIDGISMTGQDEFVFTGYEKVEIFSYGDLTINAPHVHQSGTPYPSDFVINMASGTTFDTGGNASFTGYVYAPNASARLQGGGSGKSQFYGAIICNDITSPGHGADFTYYPPSGDDDFDSVVFYRVSKWVD